MKVVLLDYRTKYPYFNIQFNFLDARKASEADARTRARIHGILVGVCLAIVFLIVLLITWCYYKNKPFRRDIHNYPTAHVRKGI